MITIGKLSVRSKYISKFNLYVKQRVLIQHPQRNLFVGKGPRYSSLYIPTRLAQGLAVGPALRGSSTPL